MRVILFVSAFFMKKKLIFPTDALTKAENFQIALVCLNSPCLILDSIFFYISYDANGLHF